MILIDSKKIQQTKEFFLGIKSEITPIIYN